MGMLSNLGPWIVSEDQIIASMLGITLNEYNELSHGGLKEVRDMNGKILYYYMEVSPLNPESILRKLNMSKSRIIFLPPDYKQRGQQFRSIN